LLTGTRVFVFHTPGDDHRPAITIESGEATVSLSKQIGAAGSAYVIGAVAGALFLAG